MTWNPEIETGDVTEDELEELSDRHKTCNGFAFWYVEGHEDAVVKDGIHDDSDSAHCYVYDAARDVTIDGTLGQFDGCADAGAWDGDRHPHITDVEEVHEWETREAFENHYGSMPEHDNPFYL